MLRRGLQRVNVSGSAAGNDNAVVMHDGAAEDFAVSLEAAELRNMWTISKNPIPPPRGTNGATNLEYHEISLPHSF
jgi:hypothetical protein